MIPVIVGAVALAAGAGVGFALGKNDKPEQVIVKKAEVSEDYVKWCAERAGKNIETNTQATPSEDFSADFKRLENMFVNPNISYVSIKNELESIRLKAKRRNDDKALNLVAEYRDKRDVSTRGSRRRFVYGA